MKALIIQMLLKLGTKALYAVINAVMDELKARPNSTVDKDAEAVKALIARNTKV